MLLAEFDNELEVVVEVAEVLVVVLEDELKPRTELLLDMADEVLLNIGETELPAELEEPVPELEELVVLEVVTPDV